MNYAQFGDIVFDVKAYNGHTLENTYSFARQETVIAPSSLEFLGPELRKISLKVQWHDAWCDDPKAEYTKLDTLCQKGDEQKLIIATQLLGDFVIEKMTVDEELTDAWGHTVYIICSLELTEYIKKKITTKKIPKSAKPAVKTSPSTNPDELQFRLQRIPSTDPNAPPLEKIVIIEEIKPK